MRKITHLTMAPVENDARIMRTTSALADAGHECNLVCPGNGISPFRVNLQYKSRLAASYGIASRLGNAATGLAYWSFSANRQACRSIIAGNPDIIHAHDWDALPAAVSAGRKLGVPVIYDSHEFAGEMHAERFAWRTFVSPAIRRLESANIKYCKKIITVSDGICNALQTMYGLEQKPYLVRNIPKYEDTQKIQRDRSKIMIHYHGVLARGRGIELAVNALARLPANYHLRLVGPWRQSDFRGMIMQLAKDVSVGDRLHVLPAVAPEDLIKLAAEAHFGLCVLPESSKQNRFALPNKLFEYIAAGLCCIISDGDDMGKIVRETSTGHVLKLNTAVELSNAIIETDRSRLDGIRVAGLTAAKNLCWENEKQTLLRVYASI